MMLVDFDSAEVMTPGQCESESLSIYPDSIVKDVRELNDEEIAKHEENKTKGNCATIVGDELVYAPSSLRYAEIEKAYPDKTAQGGGGK